MRTGRAGGKGQGRTFRIGKRRLLLVLFALLTLFTFQFFVFVERNLRPPLMHVATMRVKQITTESINKAITEQVAGHTEAERLIEWKTNADGRVSGFMLNYSEHMRITSETIETVQTTLNKIKHVPEHIPIGQAFDSAIISSFGPRVPVRFEPVGAVKVELNTRQKDAGINMILVEIYIRIVAEMAIIIPFDTKPEMVETEIPISYLLVVGDVPMYYYDNKGNPVGSSGENAPNISLPMAASPGKGKVGVSTPAAPRDAHAQEGARSEGVTAVPEDEHLGAGSSALEGDGGGDVEAVFVEGIE